MNFSFLNLVPRMPEGAGGAGETTTTTTTAPALWYTGKADAEVVGHWQNRGWADKPAEHIAIEATKAHREAEKLIGAPANELIRVPKTAADEAGWKSLWGRLGAPDDAAGYDFSTVKPANAEKIDDKLAEVLRTSAASAHLPKDAAVAVASAFVKHLDGIAASQAAERAAALVVERESLKTNWGVNFDVNKFVASQAAQKLGIDAATVTALENQVGYAKVMGMFHSLGVKMGEDKYVAGAGGQNNPGVMSVEQATAGLKDLMADKAAMAKYVAGDREVGRQMKALQLVVASGMK